MKENMKVVFHGHLGERTGYQIHASRFTEALAKLTPVSFEGEGDIHISLLDVVTASNPTARLPYPSILYSVWESTEYPQAFIDNLKNYDQLWVASEAQRAWSIAQGIKEEFVKTVPEGVDPEVYKPEVLTDYDSTFNFVHVGQFQARKSTREICEAFLKAFPDNPNVRLYLSADTLFPSDAFSSTEERLSAYGLTDSRIVPVHFEERADYIKRLQKANVFVSCSRSEGWGLPICEALACGIPTIVSDWGGTTEYAKDALLVKVPSTKKPEGIFGNWDVPGVWGEPDYEHLVEVMKDAYDNYDVHKAKALKTSDMIRTKFSWDSAAKKALELIKVFEKPEDAEEAIRSFARQRGYEITLKKRKAVFFVDCWPDNKEKMDTLTETIKQIKGFGYPVLVSCHYPLPEEVIKLADYYIYEKEDILSGDDKPMYWRRLADGTEETRRCTKEYQGVAALNCARNAIDFCRKRFDWIYMMGSDMEVDLQDWLSKVHSTEKPLVFMAYEGIKNGFGGGLWAGKTEVADKVFPRLNSWEQYANMFPDVRFVAERWLYNYVSSKIDIESNVEWIECETYNRFDNVDRDVWKDDDIQMHFCDGPFVNVVGYSDKEYEICYSNPIDGKNSYVVKQKSGMWSSASKKFYRDWTIEVKLDDKIILEHKLDLKGKRVLLSMGSKALGDTLAWIPYVDEFRKKHECHVICSSWWNQIFDYPEIEFVNPGTALEDIYAMYEIGCFDDQPNKNPINWRISPLQKVAADILGLEYEPIKAKLKYDKPEKPDKPYICFSEFSTMQSKFWNREGAWQNTIDHLIKLGYDCVSVSVEPSQLKGVVKHNGQSIEQTLTDVAGASFYVGLNHGPAWIAYSLGIPTVLITGVSEEWNDFPTPYRVSTDDCHPACFNNPDAKIDRGFTWCYNENKYVCTKNITEKMVKKAITKLRKDIDG